MNDIPIVQDLVTVNIFLYDIGFDDEALVGEPATRSVGKHSNTVCLLSYKSHLLSLWYQCTLQSLSLPIVLYFFQQSAKFGMISNHAP